MTDSNSEIMLTTVDNPFNPFTEYDEWYAFDQQMGYNTPAFLDRVAITSYDLSEPDQARAIEDAIDQIVEENVSGMWVKVNSNSIHDYVGQSLVGE
jgi:hypothetical protein